MRSIFSRLAKASRGRGFRRREVFAAQFDGGRYADAFGTSVHLGCDVLEPRAMLTASPAADFDFSQGTITGYHGAGGNVEIPSTIDGMPVVVIGFGAFGIFDAVYPIPDSGHNTAASPITSVVIPDSVAIVGDRAFQGNGSLVNVVIGKGVQTIGVAAFALDTALTGVVIPNSVITIGYGAFAHDTALTNVKIGSRVTSIGNIAFYGDTALKSVVIPNSVIHIGDNAFSGNTALTSVTIGSRVTSIGISAFYGDTALKNVVIPNSVTTIGENAFRSNTALQSVTIGTHVTSIGGNAFDGDTALASVKFTGNAPTVGFGAFSGVPLGAKAIRAAGLTGYGPNGALWNNLLVWTPGRVAAPTVTVNSANLAQNAATITIRGTGFVAVTPSFNRVTFNNGAIGTVTAATATSLTVTFTTQPTSTGPLTAIVTSVGGTSGVAKRVATVVPPPPA